MALRALAGGVSAAAALVALTASAPATANAPAAKATTIRLLFAGDVMLGRGVAKLAAADPDRVFAGISFQLGSADLAAANLESPLTLRLHDSAHGPDALEARPAAAGLLRAAGFDTMAIANNHAGDAGPATVPDTMRALARAGITTIGAGGDVAKAYRPRILEAGGIRVAFLSFDTTGQGPRARPGRPGVAWWNEARARAAVTRARSEADLVVVGLHGGTDYEPTADPYLMRLGRLLASWGADVVWGSGPHVVQPVHVVDSSRRGRLAIVATSLGNLVFDQHIPGTRQGALLEVLAGAGGVRAFRVGATDHTAGPVVFRGWRSPGRDAAALDGAWWTLAGPVATAASKRLPALTGFEGDIAVAAIGDPEGNGGRQLVVSFWRPFRLSHVNALVPHRLLVDRRGLTAHIGLYRPGDLRPEWVAGTLLRPVVRLAACDGALAVAYSTLNGTGVVGTGAWRWGGFGFVPLPDLRGRGVPACADVDGDGRLDPIILERSSR